MFTPWKTRVRVLALLSSLSSGVASAGAPTPPATTSISVEQAEAIALRRFVGGKVLEIERDVEAGVAVFELEVRDRDGIRHELVLAATDGRVLHEDIDD